MVVLGSVAKFLTIKLDEILPISVTCVLSKMMYEQGLSLAHTTIMRWVH